MAWFRLTKRAKGALGNRDADKALRRIHRALSHIDADRGGMQSRRSEAFAKKLEIKKALAGGRGADTDAMLHDYMDYTARAALEEVRKALKGIESELPEGRNARRIDFEDKRKAVEDMLKKPEGSPWTGDAVAALKEYVSFHDRKWLSKDGHKLNVLKAFIEKETTAERALKKEEAVRPKGIDAKDAHEAANKVLYKISANMMRRTVIPIKSVGALNRTINSGELNEISARFIRARISDLSVRNPKSPEIALLNAFLDPASKKSEAAPRPRETKMRTRGWKTAEKKPGILSKFFTRRFWQRKPLPERVIKVLDRMGQPIPKGGKIDADTAKAINFEQKYIRSALAENGEKIDKIRKNIAEIRRRIANGKNIDDAKQEIARTRGMRAELNKLLEENTKMEKDLRIITPFARQAKGHP